MKIMILANSDMGLYKFRKELIKFLCQNHKLIIVLPDGEFISNLKAMGCEYIKFEFNRRGMNPLADIAQLKKYIQLIRKSKPDVVLTYTIKPNIYGGIACQITQTPYLVNITGLGTSIENGGILGKFVIALYKMGLKKARCVFFQNKSNQMTFLKKKVVKKNSKLIPGSGVNLEEYSLEQYPADSTNVRFLFVGRIMKNKGIEELLYSIRKLREKYNRIGLDIVGSCDEEYSEILNRLQEQKIIQYHGLQKDVRPFYKNAYCVVLPSYHEGMANVLLEASATGRPVIASRIPGCQETFEEGTTGFGCDVRSSESLIDAMDKFLSLQQNDRKKMGLNARKKMEEEFDRSFIIQAYVEELEKVFKKNT